jgi:hypothetical protein
LSAAEQQKNAAALGLLEKRVGVSPALQPAQFIRGLARQWKQVGGTTAAGKARHSDRYLDSLLRVRGTPVRSLIPKLGGRTNFKPADASILARLFLSHWRYVGAADADIDRNSTDLYEPLFSDEQIEQVSRYIAEHIAKAQEKTGGSAASTARILKNSSGTEQKNKPASYAVSGVSLRSTREMMIEEFKQATASFSVGAGKTLLDPSLKTSGFRELINEWWKIDKDGGRQRIVIWTLDLGRLDPNDTESLVRFENISVLRSRFKALQMFVEPDAAARWKWLQSKAVVVLHDTRHVRPDRPMLPTFDPNHVLFSAIPPRWAGSREFSALYTRDRLQETTHVVFLRKSDDRLQKSTAIADAPEHRPSVDYELRYFGLGNMGRDADEPKSVKLITPGQSYVDALGTVFLAAAELLKLPGHSHISIEGMKIDQRHAIEKLRHHGFKILRLDEFMDTY